MEVAEKEGHKMLVILTTGCYADEEFYFPNLKRESGYRYSAKNCLYEAVIER